MRTLELGRFGRAHVWLREYHSTPMDASGVVSRVLSAGPTVPRIHAVGIEALVPRGPFSEYGLIGLSGTFGKEHPELRLEVPWTQVEGAAWDATLAGSPESPKLGLPQEYTHAIMEALEVAAMGRLIGGALGVRTAVHAAVGSSPNFMARLSRAGVELMLRGDLTDDELGALLEPLLLR
ncbi:MULTISPECIES: hypothetical protein [unclassified Myxococcus]|uniref:hypothetical protein n=1 Tax=unclassified Myxococcus TaxID=2648731 RepID=UPI00157A6B8A|nr:MULTISPECIES: hypothetical protein [unclassified Myxococcus]NTX34164.1 hypothetical protein [Myxococcus sp. CA033]